MGNGNKIRSWKDSWIPNVGPLIDYLLVSANINVDSLLCDLSIEEGNWNFDVLQAWLLKEVIYLIRGIPTSHPLEGPDRLSSRHTSIGVLSIKSTFKIVKEDSWGPKDKLWKKTWKLLGPQRVRFFIWTILKQRLLTNAERTRRGIAVDPWCLVCGHELEDIIHIIRGYTLAKEVRN